METRIRFYAVRCVTLDKALDRRGLDHNGFWLVAPMAGDTEWSTLMGPAPMSMEDANALAVQAAKEHPEATFELVRVDITAIPFS